MERDDTIWSVKAELLDYPRRLEPIPEGEQRVDHRVADEMHALDRDSFSREVPNRLRAGDEMEIREGVGDDSVDLLRHRTVETPKSGFYMRDRNLHLRCGHCSRQRRIDVAVDHDPLRPHL